MMMRAAALSLGRTKYERVVESQTTKANNHKLHWRQHRNDTRDGGSRGCGPGRSVGAPRRRRRQHPGPRARAPAERARAGAGTRMCRNRFPPCLPRCRHSLKPRPTPVRDIPPPRAPVLPTPDLIPLTNPATNPGLPQRRPRVWPDHRGLRQSPFLVQLRPRV